MIEFQFGSSSIKKVASNESILTGLPDDSPKKYNKITPVVRSSFMEMIINGNCSIKKVLPTSFRQPRLSISTTVLPRVSFPVSERTTQRPLESNKPLDRGRRGCGKSTLESPMGDPSPFPPPSGAASCLSSRWCFGASTSRSTKYSILSLLPGRVNFDMSISCAYSYHRQVNQHSALRSGLTTTNVPPEF